MSKYLVDAYWESLMDHPVAGGGHGSGGGKSKKPRISGAIAVCVLRAAPERRIPRFRVRGLTRGEEWYYDTRPGVAEKVLGDLLAAIVEMRAPETAWPFVRGVRRDVRRDAFSVYGLTEPEIEALRRFGGASAYLAKIARDRGGSRVENYDISMVPKTHRGAHRAA